MSRIGLASLLVRTQSPLVSCLLCPSRHLLAAPAYMHMPFKLRIILPGISCDNNYMGTTLRSQLSSSGPASYTLYAVRPVTYARSATGIHSSRYDHTKDPLTLKLPPRAWFVFVFAWLWLRGARGARQPRQLTHPTVTVTDTTDDGHNPT